MEDQYPFLLVFFVPIIGGAFLTGIILRWVGKPLRLKPLALGAGSWFLAVIIVGLIPALIPADLIFGGAAGAFVGGLGTCLSLKAGSIRLTTVVVMQSSLAWAASFGIVVALIDTQVDFFWDIGTTVMLAVAGTIGSVALVYGLAREQ